MKRIWGAVLALTIIMTSLPAARAAGTSASSAILMEAGSGLSGGADKEFEL